MPRRTISFLAGAALLVAGIAVYFITRPHPAPIPVPVDDKKSPVPVETARYTAPLVIAVHAVYPGANALTVRDTVAAPIEEQVNGVEHMLSMSSQSGNDGSYTLNVTFEAGTNLDIAQVMVQNRVSLAVPVLPDLVQREGISVRKKSPEPLVLVSLTSPDNRFDALYLSNYATIQIKDELARVPGVGDIVLFGQRDSRMRVLLDADKLETYKLSAMDVIAAISAQNVQVAAGPIGQPPAPKSQQFQLTIDLLGRLIEPDQFEGIILKAIPDGGVVRLKDVARVEMVTSEPSRAILNGKPALILSIHTLPSAKPSEVSRAVLDKLAELRVRLPDGLALAVAFDFAANLDDPNNSATPEHLVVDAQLPDAASLERTSKVLERAAEIVRQTPGVESVLALTEHPFSLMPNRPCLVVRLAPKDGREFARDEIARKLRAALHDQIPDALFRLSVPSTAGGFPVYGFPIEFAIEDIGNRGTEFLRQRADALEQKMSQSGKFSDASVGAALRGVPFVYLEIDRTKCQALGVETSEIFKTLQVALGTYYVNNFNQFGRTWQVNVQPDPRFRERVADILQLQVKGKDNQLVRLGAVMSVRDTTGPTVIERHNMYPIARVTPALQGGRTMKTPEKQELCASNSEKRCRFRYLQQRKCLHFQRFIVRPPCGQPRGRCRSRGGEGAVRNAGRPGIRHEAIQTDLAEQVKLRGKYRATRSILAIHFSAQ